PNQGVTLANETSGVIDQISFGSGTDVKNDQLLVRLDSGVEKANLKSSEARLPAAKAKYKRYQGLYKKGSISKEAYD
ncbi:efflux transporter periplasmic adaptor subunit, partial [Vibrio sp. 10N.222.52.B7]